MTNVQEDTNNVLVIEDEPDFAVLIASVLAERGYNVSCASSAEIALRMVEESIPDLITLDLQMPAKSGLHFYREMKSRERCRQIPVVIVTGVTKDDPDMKNFVRSFLEVDHLPPPEAYIEKPFDNQELVDVVRRAITGN